MRVEVVLVQVLLLAAGAAGTIMAAGTANFTGLGVIATAGQAGGTGGAVAGGAGFSCNLGWFWCILFRRSRRWRNHFS